MTTRRIFLREEEDADNKLNETLEIMIICMIKKTLSITEMSKISQKKKNQLCSYGEVSVKTGYFITQKSKNL